MTTIAFATDVHRDGRIFPWLDEMMHSHDVVAIGGDLDDPCLGSPNAKVNYVMHKLRPNRLRDRLLARAREIGENRLLVVLGNHDNPDPASLHGRTVATSDGLIVGGVGGSLPTGPFPFQLEEWEYASILDKLGRVDILVTHEPPHGTACDIAHGGRHMGSRAVRDYCLRERPRLVLTGHIHESPSVDRLGRTVLVNPGPFFTGRYGLAEVPMGGGEVNAKIEGMEKRPSQTYH
jgi:Icc-related predicted phosphoesterase